MNLRLSQTFYRRQSISTDHTRIDYEDSEDESLSSSPENHRLSSSTGTYPFSNHLRKSTSSLSHSSLPQCTNSSPHL